MTANSFAANALEALLGWFEALMNGIVSLFSGSGGTLLKWLSNSWIPLLVFFLIVGVVMDVVVYMFRWRPFWWWFRKKRMVVDDRILDEQPRHRRSEPARVTPSTKVPVRVTRYHEDVEEKDEDNDLFMESTLFDVKPNKKRSSSGDLYAPTRPRENSDRRRKMS